MLADVPAGGSPAGGNFPVAAEAISAVGKGDRPGESADGKAPVGWVKYRSGPPEGRANRQAVAQASDQQANQETPKRYAHLKRMVGDSGAPSFHSQAKDSLVDEGTGWMRSTSSPGS
jgi:hypothetical protein